MRGFFLAAGLGTRMKEYTKATPKPLLELDGIRLIDYSLYLAKTWSISEGVTNTHYLANQIQQYLKGFTGFPLHISPEADLLGTGGGIYTALQRFFFPTDYWVVFNPDTLLFPYSLGFRPRSDFYPNSLYHLYLKPYPAGANYTKLYLREGKLSFEPIADSVLCYYMGLSVFHSNVWTNIPYPPETKFELSWLWKNLAKEGKLSGEIFPGDAMDIGEKEFYEELLSKHGIFSNRERIIASIRDFYPTKDP